MKPRLRLRTALLGLAVLAFATALAARPLYGRLKVRALAQTWQDEAFWAQATADEKRVYLEECLKWGFADHDVGILIRDYATAESTPVLMTALSRHPGG